MKRLITHKKESIRDILMEIKTSFNFRSMALQSELRYFKDEMRREISELKENFDGIKDLQNNFWIKQLEIEKNLKFLVDQSVDNNFNIQSQYKILERHENQITKIDLRLKIKELEKKN